ncbi:hypothetical protein [Paractinoplanes lichenicola]|uniref:hypothetical protein n=1 Tax=Paractinoplanes lichenicola TaxID=2802976 RepID=UPI0019343FB0|nr:hypothetical protein [Actinoplanes lichenicola]
MTGRDAAGCAEIGSDVSGCADVGWNADGCADTGRDAAGCAETGRDAAGCADVGWGAAGWAETGEDVSGCADVGWNTDGCPDTGSSMGSMTTGWATGEPVIGWGMGGGSGVIAPRPLWESSQPRPWGSLSSSAGAAGAAETGSEAVGRSHTEPLGSGFGDPMSSTDCPAGSVDTGPADGSYASSGTEYGGAVTGETPRSSASARGAAQPPSDCCCGPEVAAC